MQSDEATQRFIDQFIMYAIYRTPTTQAPLMRGKISTAC